MSQCVYKKMFFQIYDKKNRSDIKRVETLGQIGRGGRGCFDYTDSS